VLSSCPAVSVNGDDFVKHPTSALRFISLSLRRTTSTPRDTRFARLEFGTFYKVVCKPTFYESIKGEKRREKNPPPRYSKTRATLPGRFSRPPFSGEPKNIQLHFN
jgi:hypothetical protein